MVGGSTQRPSQVIEPLFLLIQFVGILKRELISREVIICVFLFSGFHLYIINVFKNSVVHLIL